MFGLDGGRGAQKETRGWCAPGFQPVGLRNASRRPVFGRACGPWAEEGRRGGGSGAGAAKRRAHEAFCGPGGAI